MSELDRPARHLFSEGFANRRDDGSIESNRFEEYVSSLGSDLESTC